jgi:hypothetical protein
MRLSRSVGPSRIQCWMWWGEMKRVISHPGNVHVLPSRWKTWLRSQVGIDPRGVPDPDGVPVLAMQHDTEARIARQPSGRLGVENGAAGEGTVAVVEGEALKRRVKHEGRHVGVRGPAAVARGQQDQGIGPALLQGRVVVGPLGGSRRAVLFSGGSGRSRAKRSSASVTTAPWSAVSVASRKRWEPSRVHHQERRRETWASSVSSTERRVASSPLLRMVATMTRRAQPMRSFSVAGVANLVSSTTLSRDKAPLSGDAESRGRCSRA